MNLYRVTGVTTSSFCIYIIAAASEGDAVRKLGQRRPELYDIKASPHGGIYPDMVLDYKESRY